MVLVRFLWPYGGQRVFLTGSFLRWERHYVMAPIENLTGVFQTFLDLPVGFYQYRFLVDGAWRFDESLPYIYDGYGMINNLRVVIEENIMPSTPQNETQIARSTNVGTSLSMGSSTSNMPVTSTEQIPETDIQVSRYWISSILATTTVYDMLPISNKVVLLDAQMPVKTAFQVMYKEGLPVIPIWDQSRATVGGMLTASDFMLVLRWLQKNAAAHSNEELASYTISDWKQFKLQHRNSVWPAAIHSSIMHHVTEKDCLKDLAVKIIQNEISSVPMLESSSSHDASCMPLLTVVSLPDILKYISNRYREAMKTLPLLQQPISKLSIGTWLPYTGRSNGRELALLRFGDPITSAFQLFLQGRMSSIPVVDGSGSLIDVFSLSDFLTLTKGDASAHVQVHQMTMHQALQLVYQIKGHRPSATCFCTSTLWEVIEQLSDPAVRRLVVVDAISKRVGGIISLRDVLMFLL